MKPILSITCVLLFGALSSASTWAACGGGGYQPAQQTSNRTELRSDVTATVTNTPRTESRTIIPASQTTASTLDTTRFNEISGRLGMDYKQATDVIAAMREIRSKESDGLKDFDAKKEFENRLSQILTPKQYQTYQARI